MINVTATGLCIHIADSEPMERRDQLIKAIAASIRWKAYTTGEYTDDTHNTYILAQLLEELIDIDDNKCKDL